MGLTLAMMAAAPLATQQQQCLLQALETATEHTTVAELRAQCAEPIETDTLAAQRRDTDVSEPQESALEQRIEDEEKVAGSDFSLTAHRHNYILPFTYNDTPNQAPFDPEELPLQRSEIKFQFSFKLPLTVPLFSDSGRLFFAYTNQSWWQAYNTDHSAPFRETNHEPELFWAQKVDWQLGDWRLPVVGFGINHQSNGQNGDKSRSWNRLVGTAVFERGDWTVAATGWYRLPEDEKTSPEDSRGDDNPDITDYLGYGELGVLYKYQEHTFMGQFRNNLDVKDNRGSAELGWTFPLGNKVRGYVQYFYGYGESLIDYNVKTNRIGVGLEMTPIL
ncbi:phospholipase A [Ferrimonas kyonanensis]|uniref:phospholipase A n=1 Tax=Ferrimonas kyonanensis TaxID=364763 RepID=UPI0004035908|nr:phospholipase A [Ferrimonas kyonanensis]